MKPRLLSLSLDQSLLSQPRGNVLERQLAYAQTFKTVTIIIPTTNQYPLKKIKNLTIIPTNSFSKLNFPADLIKIASQYQFDLITAQDPFLTGLAGAILKKRLQKPLNLQCHTNFFQPSFYLANLRNFLLFTLSRLVIPQAESIRVVTQAIKDSLKKKFSRISSKIFIAPVPSHLSLFLKVQPAKARQKQVITVARLEKEKNLDRLITAFKNTHHKFPDWQLIIIGTGSQEKALKKLTQNLDLENSVKFLGQLKPSQIAQHYSQSQIFVLPSQYEGWGMVILEAMASSLPVITTKVGVANSVIKNNHNGLLIEKTPRSLEKKLNWLISHPKQRQRIAHQAKISLKEFFQTQPQAQDISRLLIKHTL